MPFVNQEHREKPDLTIPGDRCGVWYKWLIQEWRKERRWTTADKLYAQVLEYHTKKALSKESIRALDLAWGVFFNLEVMPYELEQRQKNGDY